MRLRKTDGKYLINHLHDAETAPDILSRVHLSVRCTCRLTSSGKESRPARRIQLSPPRSDWHRRGRRLGAARPSSAGGTSSGTSGAARKSVSAPRRGHDTPTCALRGGTMRARSTVKGDIGFDDTVAVTKGIRDAVGADGRRRAPSRWSRREYAAFRWRDLGDNAPWRPSGGFDGIVWCSSARPYCAVEIVESDS